MPLERRFVLLIAFALNSCSSQGPRAPRPESVEPAELIAGDETNVTVHGTDFWLDVHAQFAGNGELRSDDAFVLTLSGMQLTGVERVDSETLTATIPAGLAIGLHELVVTDPAGRVGRLADAVSVIPAAIDAVVIEDAAAGAGSEVEDVTLWLGQLLSLNAVGRLQGSFVRDESVRWSVSGGIGSVVPFEGSSTQFLAETEGSGQVTADAGSLRDVTGTLTVRSCSADADCADADACNGSESCSGGRCVPGSALQCDDGDPCTDNACDATTGCTTKPSAIADADDDGFSSVACNGDDCDDDPFACGAACNPGIGSDPCDGFNNDCDADTDEDFVGLPTACGTGYCAAVGATECVGGLEGDSCSAGTPLSTDDTTCDNVDDDCDGTADDDYVADTTCGVGICAAGNTPSSCSVGIETACQPGVAGSEGPLADPSCSNGDDDDCDGLTDAADESCSGGPGVDTCAWVSWGTVNAGSIDLTMAADLLDPPAAGRSMAVGDWSGSASHAEVGGFASGGRGEVIVAVELGMVFYVGSALIDDIVELSVAVGGAAQGSPVGIGTTELNLRTGATRAGATFVDISGARSWDWADLDDASTTLTLDAVATGADDGSLLYVDTLGLRILYECNTPPRARFTLDPAGGNTTTSFSLDASGSTDAEDPTADLQVQWDWEGDGSWNTALSLSKTPSVTYLIPGPRSIALRVVDTGGVSGYASRPVSVVAPSDILEVTTDIDESDSGESSSPPHQGGGLSLREAIILSNASPASETIVIAPGLVAAPDSLGTLPAFSDSVTLVGDGRVLIDGGLLGGDCLTITGGTVELWGIEVTACSTAGIEITGGGGILSLRDSWVHDVGLDCIFVASQPGQLVGPGNELGPNCRNGIQFVGSTAGDATVVGNRIHHSSDNGIQVGTTPSNAGSNNLIERNVIWGNGGDGIKLTRSSTGNTIIHNTIVDNGEEGIDFGSSSSSVQVVSANLIALHPAGSGIDAGGSTFSTLDFNLYYDAGVDNCTGCVVGPNAVLLDPLFVDAAAADFRLRDGSPAIDTATDLGVDLNGPAPGNWSRGGPDIGALEAP